MSIIKYIFEFCSEFVKKENLLVFFLMWIANFSLLLSGVILYFTNTYKID